MSELEKAKQIAAEAFNFKSKAYTTIEQQNEIIEVNRKAFMQILSLPSITIPKSVADYSEKLEQYANPQNKNWKKFLPTEQEEQEHWAWLRKDNNKHIYQAYLAGKALGVDLVKVVEG